MSDDYDCKRCPLNGHEVYGSWMISDDDDRWGPKGDEMWMSTRALRPAGDDESPRTVRTIDERFNPIVAGNFVVTSLDEVWDLLDVAKWLPTPIAGREYTLLFMEHHTVGSLPDHPRLKPLGYDLTDDHGSWSTLQDPCVWAGDLEAVATRRGEYGLLNFADARLAQALFRDAWPGIPHFTVWAMFEIVPDIESVIAESSDTVVNGA